jgi:long-subunit fatty acid transport protein
MEQVDVYEETKIIGPSTLQQLTLNDRLEISGSGGVWSLGLILQPKSSPVRLGWSYRSGTVLSIDDFYQVDASAEFSVGGTYEAASPNSYVRYRIRTPRRHQLGLSWTMGKAAVLSLDYGRSDYAEAEFTSDDFFDEDVAAIQQRIDNALLVEQLFRGGLEFRIDEDWRLRMGGGWRSAAADPSQGPSGELDGSLLEDGSDALHWAFGAEYRDDNWYAGATYRHTSTDDARRLYSLGPEVATGRTGLGLLMLTIGARY